MGMFDEIVCYYPLPNKEDEGHILQTKSLDSALNIYTIERDGSLRLHGGLVEETLLLHFYSPDYYAPIVNGYVVGRIHTRREDAEIELGVGLTPSNITQVLREAVSDAADDYELAVVLDISDRLGLGHAVRKLVREDEWDLEDV